MKGNKDLNDCCVRSPLNFSIRDASGALLEIEQGGNGSVIINVIEVGDNRSQMFITKDISQLTAIRGALDRFIQSAKT